MTVRDTTNGFKALVRKGALCQEVFISTTKMNLEEVKVIDRSIDQHAGVQSKYTLLL